MDSLLEDCGNDEMRWFMALQAGVFAGRLSQDARVSQTDGLRHARLPRGGIHGFLEHRFVNAASLQFAKLRGAANLQSWKNPLRQAFVTSMLGRQVAACQTSLGRVGKLIFPMPRASPPPGASPAERAPAAAVGAWRGAGDRAAVVLPSGRESLSIRPSARGR